MPRTIESDHRDKRDICDTVPTNDTNDDSAADGTRSETKTEEVRSETKNEEIETLSLRILLPTTSPHAVSIVVGRPIGQVMVSPLETVQDIRQTIQNLPQTIQHTNFALYFGDQKISEYCDLKDVDGIIDNPTVKLVELEYNSQSAKNHFIRVAELIGYLQFPGCDPGRGYCPGLSQVNQVMENGLKLATGDTPAIADYTLGQTNSVDDIQCVKSIQLAPWNPPPPSYRLQGHHFYIQLCSLEGETYHITSCNQGFYVSRSTQNKFDPSPRHANQPPVHSLISLFRKLSCYFAVNFETLLSKRQEVDALTYIPINNTTPAYPWLVVNSAQRHPNALLIQQMFLRSNVDESLRDWNDEVQSVRELPFSTVQERIFRDHLMCKILNEFTACATKAVMLVRAGELQPLNPLEEARASMYIYNNIFISKGADGIATFAEEGGDLAAWSAASRDLNGVRFINEILHDSNIPLCTLATVIVDYLGERFVAQSLVPGLFRQVVGTNEEDGSVQQPIIYGGIDGRGLIVSDPHFDEQLGKLVKKGLRTKRHITCSKKNVQTKLYTSLDVKGLRGTDGREYILDLYRLSPVDIEFLDKDLAWDSETPYPHKLAILRLELVELFWEYKSRLWANERIAQVRKETSELTFQEKNQTSFQIENGIKADGQEDKAPIKIDFSEFEFGLNPDAFTNAVPESSETHAQALEDEHDVREAAVFLRETVIPCLIEDILQGKVAAPLDGQSLTRLLHRRGINMRYLGRIAKLLEERNNEQLESLWLIVVHEMASRSVKHLLNQVLSRSLIHECQAHLAHYLNCLLATPDVECDKMTKKEVHEAVKLSVHKRFRYDLPVDFFEVILEPVPLLREVSLKLGLQLQRHDNDFLQMSDNGNWLSVTLVADDILHILPIVKDAGFKSTLAEDALEAGRMSILQGQRELGVELLGESLSLLEQIYDVVHPHVARGYNRLAVIYHQIDQDAFACELAKKAAIISERTLGVDNAETILIYLNWGLFEHSLGNTEQGLKYISHALSYWYCTFGRKHPDTVTATNNVAVMLQSQKDYRQSLQWFTTSLSLCKRLFGDNSLNTATLYFQVAQAQALVYDSKDAVNSIRAAYSIFKRELGPEDKNTKETEFWLEQLTASAVNLAKKANQMSAKKLRKPLHSKFSAAQAQSVVAETTGYSSGASTASAGCSNMGIEELLRYIEGPENKTTKKKQQVLKIKRR